MLRAIQIGLTLEDLACLEYGFIMDLLTESGNDSEHYDALATQDDMDRF